MNYYNENEPKAAEWLRALVDVGLIPEGEVDERSIADVEPGDLEGYRQCHFFAGIGGWSYALELAGWDESRPVWTGSCPCQPFSAAGKRRGTDDARHLWPEFARLIGECSPPVVFGEQVASKAGREWLSGVRADLEALGYGVGAADLCAASAGAPHIRQRLFWVADAKGERDDGRHETIRQAQPPGAGTAGAGGVGDTSSAGAGWNTGAALGEEEGSCGAGREHGLHGGDDLEPSGPDGEAGGLSNAGHERNSWRIQQPEEPIVEGYSSDSPTSGPPDAARNGCNKREHSRKVVCKAGQEPGEDERIVVSDRSERSVATSGPPDAESIGCERRENLEREGTTDQQGREQDIHNSTSRSIDISPSTSTSGPPDADEGQRGRFPDGEGREFDGAAPGRQQGDCEPEPCFEPSGSPDTETKRLERQGVRGRSADTREPGPWSDYRVIEYADGKRRRIPTEPAFYPLDARLPGRVVQLRGLGNAIVPQVAAEFIGAYGESRV